jgi:hypothetical protein
MTDEESAEVTSWLTRTFIARAPEQARRILDTTTRTFNRATALAREEQSPIEQRLVAARLAAPRTLAQASTAATYEILWASEVAKEREVLVLIGESDELDTKHSSSTDEEWKVSLGRKIKEWDSFDDSRVREDHLTVSGQERRVREAFVLPDGSRMNHPGDSSMGAPLRQLVGCRCSAIYNVRTVRQLRSLFLEKIRRLTGFDRVPAVTESTIIVAGHVGGGNA